MKIRVEETNDALYFRLDESAIIESEEIQPGIILDFNDKGQTVGIERLGIKGHIPEKELKRLQFETV